MALLAFAVPFWGTFQASAGPRAIERAAQVRQESSFNPRAVSPVGAQGLSQFMPSTWRDAQRRGWVPAGADPFDPAAAVAAQHAYMQWLEARVGGDRAAALGSYNAGLGSIRKAQALAQSVGLQGSRAWLEALPRVTGAAHARETHDYIQRIETRHIPWVTARVGGRP